ncbi:rho GTPase-activating protein 6 [Willisornis vidua]|uniref:Rho GTPase-activating protein 6 n=1 Tax=Willisornis vidua TaxID=1566151 RepID=A0ABQ9CSB8_9PASS|nr:rho GTPase-activating protein 6 [Willisornis vidua]
MSAQSLLSSVFSCSSPAAAAPAAAKSLSKRRLRQTRSLDPAIIGGGREDGEGAGRAPRARGAGSPPGERRGPRGALPLLGASFSTPSTPLERSPPGSALFDEESLRGKRSPGCELPFLSRTPSALALSGPANSIFSSPRRWLQQRKGQPSPPEPRPAAYVVWKSERQLDSALAELQQGFGGEVSVTTCQCSNTTVLYATTPGTTVLDSDDLDVPTKLLQMPSMEKLPEQGGKILLVLEAALISCIPSGPDVPAMQMKIMLHGPLDLM